jgi:FAD/FMN-containing dehydrogenase
MRRWVPAEPGVSPGPAIRGPRRRGPVRAASEGTTDRAVRELRARLPGIVHAPGTPEHDAARRVYFTAVDRYPSAVLRPRAAGEVAEAVRIVAAEGGRLTVKGGGHGFASRGVADGLPMLDLSALDGISIDGTRRLARAGGGITTAAYTREAGRQGLATGFGDSPKVGVGGITQAGGIGFLHRRLGLTVDSLVSAQVVTADGRIREVDGERDPELFWALRGGGGGFGVVTRLDFRLDPVDRVVGGMLMAPTDPEAFHLALQHLLEAPEEVSGIVQAMRAPAVPLVPVELHDSMMMAVFLVHSGEPADGDRWMAGFRKLAPPVMDTLAPISYPELFGDHGGPPDPPRIRWRSVFRESLSLDEIRSLFELLEAPHEGVMRTLQVRPMGGAAARPAPDATAFAHRDAPLLASAGAVFSAESDAESHDLWVRAMCHELAGGKPRGAYAGFLGPADPEGPAAAWAGPHRDRLTAVKERYDPHRIFHAPADLRSGGW